MTKASGEVGVKVVAAPEPLRLNQLDLFRLHPMFIREMVNKYRQYEGWRHVSFVVVYGPTDKMIAEVYEDGRTKLGWKPEEAMQFPTYAKAKAVCDTVNKRDDAYWIHSLAEKDGEFKTIAWVNYEDEAQAATDGHGANYSAEKTAQDWLSQRWREHLNSLDTHDAEVVIQAIREANKRLEKQDAPNDAKSAIRVIEAGQATTEWGQNILTFLEGKTKKPAMPRDWIARMAEAFAKIEHSSDVSGEQGQVNEYNETGAIVAVMRVNAPNDREMTKAISELRHELDTKWIDAAVASSRPSDLVLGRKDVLPLGLIGSAALCFQARAATHEAWSANGIDQQLQQHGQPNDRHAKYLRVACAAAASAWNQAADELRIAFKAAAARASGAGGADTDSSSTEFYMLSLDQSKSSDALVWWRKDAAGLPGGGYTSSVLSAGKCFRGGSESRTVRGKSIPVEASLVESIAIELQSETIPTHPYLRQLAGSRVDETE